MDWTECVRWCHAKEPTSHTDELLLAYADHVRRSQYEQPILVADRQCQGRRAAGYLLMYPGALGSFGRMRIERSSEEDEASLTAGTLVIQELDRAAREQGAELVQMISGLVPVKLTDAEAHTKASLVSEDSFLDHLLRNAGLKPLACLVQMACHDIRNLRMLDVAKHAEHNDGQYNLVPYSEFSESEWQAVIEQTYEQTLDVPELNGMRRIENTLEGYAASSMQPLAWWGLCDRDKLIGCLLLSRQGRSIELTYLGIVPEYRGRGLSSKLMNHMREWAIAQNIQRITLAVDLRNLPAIRLYQSCGFMTERFVQAWLSSAAGQ